MRNQKTIKSWVKAITAMLITFALAGPTASQVVSSTDIDDRIPVSITADNPCTQVYDNIDLAGETRIKGDILTDETGVQYFNGRISTDLSGADDFGVQYMIKEEMKINDRFPGEGPFSEIYKLKMNTRGPLDNYYVKVKYQISGTGEVKFSSESGCRN